MLLKKMIQSSNHLNVDLIKRKISSFNFVSFDLFDTLIKRTVASPNDVFRLIEQDGSAFDGFADKRIAAQRTAKINRAGEEINLEEIYDNLEGVSKEYCHAYMNLEIAAEKSVCCSSQEMKEIFNWCVEQKKEIVIITDTYLPFDAIRDILESSGYAGYRKLYVSSQVGLKKSTGNLFKYVCEDLGVTASEIIHIGDSIKSDCLMAIKAGYSAILIPRYVNHLRFNHLKGLSKEDKPAYKTLKSFINAKLPLTSNPYYRFGYESFGPLLYYFNKWMVRDLESRSINRVFFFSRDGYIIRRAFKEMYPDSNIEDHYIYVSRRSLRVPFIGFNPKLEDVLYYSPYEKILNMEKFLKNIGLNPNEYNDILSKHNLKLETEFFKKDVLTNNNIVQFYDEIVSMVIENSKNEFNLLIEYLKQEGFYGDVAVVDIGWHGTLQLLLSKLIENSDLKIRINGYYIGVSKNAKIRKNVKGFVVDKHSGNYDPWIPFVGLAETLFLAQDGSTERYCKKDGVVIPVKYPYEYQKSNGEYEPEAEQVAALQDGAIHFVRDCASNKMMNNLSISSSAAWRNIFFTGSKPAKHELDLFADFKFLEGSVTYLANPQNIGHYFRHPQKLLKDYASAKWKVGFLKRLFKIPLPYNLLVTIVSMIWNKIAAKQ
jgi:predicted HAD superfamily hydrolase